MRTRLNLEIRHQGFALILLALLATLTTGCTAGNGLQIPAKNLDTFDTTTGRHFGNLSATKPPHTVAKPVVQQATNYQYQAPNVIPPRARSANINPRLIDPNVRHRTSNVQQAAYQYPATNPPTTGFQATAPRIGFQAQPVAAQNFGQFPNGFPLNGGIQDGAIQNGAFPNGTFQNGAIQNGSLGAPQTFLPGAAQGQLQQQFVQPQFAQPQFAQPQNGQLQFGQTQFQQPQIQQQFQQQAPSFFQTPTPLQTFPPNVVPLGPNGQLPTLPLDVFVSNAPTSQFRIGGTYGSENGLVGQAIFEERDFDIWAWPGRSPFPFRGGGQTLRLEAVPGSDLQRYLISFADPNFRNSDYSFSLSGYLFERRYFDWDEKRFGGRVGLGRVLSDYLTFDAGLRMESVTIDNPRLGTSPQLNEALGNSNLFLGSVGLTYDTRFDRRTNSRAPFVTPEGSYLNLKYSQAFGDFSFSRGEIDYRRHNMIYERPDGSGRHTIGFRTKLGFSGSSTPVFENFFAGGLSSLRGFDFRGISPVENGIRVGGEFQWLNSLEYMFPLDTNDNIYGVMFVDFGTVEESVELNSENFRVAPGLGLRLNLPFAGLGGAPLAFDFAFPVSTGTGDEEKSFHFMIGLSR